MSVLAANKTTGAPPPIRIRITKRGGASEDLVPDKMRATVRSLIKDDLPGCDVDLLVRKVVAGCCPGMTSRDVSDLLSRQAATLGFTHPDYLVAAARVAVAALRKETPPTFSEAVSALAFARNKNGEPAPLVDKSLATFVGARSVEIDAAVAETRAREMDLTHFGLSTLRRAYLLRMPDGSPVETPAYMWMRVALGVSGRGEGVYDWDRALEVFDLLSRRRATLATPTLFNSGTPRPQLSSCFLVTAKDDSIEGIFNTVSECAAISKYSGGIGLSVSQIRATGSYIKGTGGTSNGILPMLKVFNATARYVDQGGGKRKGSFAVYLEPWHADLFDFLNLRKNIGDENMRCRDLFTALWVNDLFMRRVKEGGDWSLFCPSDAPDLQDSWGADFEARYEAHEAAGRARRTVPAREVWGSILESQVETGTPYMVFKDTANRCSNQQHLGCVRSSNLCAEIIEYSSADETAVCNLGSVVLGNLVSGDGRSFDFDALAGVTRTMISALDRVIDTNFYPVETARRSNLRHRPVGLGVQGLTDVFLALRVPFSSPEAVKLSADIMETMYFAALDVSCDLAAELGAYETFPGSPASEGRLQFDLRSRTEHVYAHGRIGRSRWETLKEKIRSRGLRNSLLLAVMPTASTAQICGSVESVEPLVSNLSTRRTIAGEFACINAHLVHELEAAGMWNDDTRNLLARDRGSAQRLPLPPESKPVYLTAYEMSQRWLLDHAAARQDFICQSQSMNLYVSNDMLEAGARKVSSMLMYAFDKQLKTGIYYMRTRPRNHTSQFTVNVEAAESLARRIESSKKGGQQRRAGDDEEEEECLMCGA